MTSHPLRNQLIRLLEADDAHMRFEEAVADFPDDAINARPPNVGYTPWHLVEHLRITQWDILEYVRNPAWVSPDWPIGYWPDPSPHRSPTLRATHSCARSGSSATTTRTTSASSRSCAR